MRKRNEIGSINEKRLLNIIEVCTYTGLGRGTARQLMDDIGATIKIGGRILFDKKVIDEYIDNINK